MEIIEGDAAGAAQGQCGAGVSESARSGDFGDLSAAVAAIVPDVPHTDMRAVRHLVAEVFP